MGGIICRFLEKVTFWSGLINLYGNYLPPRGERLTPLNPIPTETQYVRRNLAEDAVGLSAQSPPGLDLSRDGQKIANNEMTVR